MLRFLLYFLVLWVALIIIHFVMQLYLNHLSRKQDAQLRKFLLAQKVENTRRKLEKLK